jgi:hypothetical protein
MSERPIEWSYNPWREQPARALAGSLGAGAFAVVVLALGLPWIMAIVLMIAAIAPLAVVFVPMRLRLDEGGASRLVGPLTEKRSWERVRRAVRRRDGLLLTPFAARSWLDSYLGFFLPVPRQAAPPPAEDLDRMLASHGL